MCDMKCFFPLIGDGELVEKVFEFSGEYLMGRLKKECLDYIVKFLGSALPAAGDVLRFYLLARRFELAEVKEITMKILQNISITELEKCEHFTMVGLEEVFFNKIKHMESLMRTSKDTINRFTCSLKGSMQRRCSEHVLYSYGCKECSKCDHARITSVEEEFGKHVYNGEAQSTSEQRRACSITNIQDQYAKCLGEGPRWVL